MAERTATAKKLNRGMVEVTYSGNLTESDTCEAVDITSFGPVSGVALGVSGDFGSGGDIALEGSVDGTNFFELNALAGSNIAQTAAGIVNTKDLVRFMRPAVGAGTSVSVVPVLQIFLS